jgi:hypothetical protein
MIAEFAGDDAEYLDWVATHPTAYVLNVRAKHKPSYIVLHLATCGTIAARREAGRLY